MKTLLLITACVLSTLAPLQARIGDTLAQCQERYGEITEKEGNRYWFSKGGIKIDVCLIDEKVGLIAFKKTDNRRFSENEKHLLMEANGGGQTWEEIKDLSIDDKWMKEDCSAIAENSSDRKWFVILTKKWHEHANKEAKAKENESLEGF